MSSEETPRRARDPDSGAQQTSLAQIFCALPVALYLFAWALAGHQLLWTGALIALANLVILGIMVLVLAADRVPADDDS
ncbi:MAG: hypothetical protein JXA74_08985 [Anaerolineae bacterium]|nr:hypothetical protein [Anaerolineae bacterium]